MTYSEKRLQAFREKFCFRVGKGYDFKKYDATEVEAFLAETIEELYAELQPKDVTALYAGLRVLESDYLPKDVCMIGTGKKCGSAAFSQKVEVKAEAERMRDLSIEGEDEDHLKKEGLIGKEDGKL